MKVKQLDDSKWTKKDGCNKCSKEEPHVHLKQVEICKDCGHLFKEGMTWCVEVKRIFEDDHCKNCSVESFLYYSVDY